MLDPVKIPKTLMIANNCKICKCLGRETLDDAVGNLQRQMLEQKSTSILRSWW